MMKTTVPPNNLDFLLKQLKALANLKRLQILNLLMEGVQCNCELGDALNMPINLISHHMGLLRKAGLVNVERDAVDARWVYFSINEVALEALNQAHGAFFDLGRIQPRRPHCGPQGAVVGVETIVVAKP